MRRWIRRIAVGVLVLVLTAVVLAVVDIRGQLPDRSTPRIPGLTAPVEVRFDARDIPTVRARTLQDAFRVQGYLHARERLFQMELARRLAGGELSELVGSVALPLDRRQRIYGFAHVAEDAVRAAPEDLRDDAQALADGINTFIATHRGRWGLEFQLLALEPRPWTPADSIRLLLLFHQQLSESWKADLFDEALTALPPARRTFLTPDVSSDDVLVLPDAEPRPPPSTAALLTAGAPPAGPLPRPPVDGALEVLGVPLEPWSGGAPPDVGSNAWVIGGAHTARGKPILANDPHLGFGIPGTWYPMRIELVDAAGNVQRWVQGVSPAGLPGLVIFQNDRLAIGFTNIGTDIQDLYREPEVRQRVETIRVKGAPAETFTVSLGRHGPMVRPGLALSWAALDPSTLRAPIGRMMLATDWASLNAALDGFLGPGQNIMYADADGHVGWRASGVLPLRAPGDDGRTPLDGTSSAHDWTGYLGQERMPRLLDPPSGRLVTANERVIGTSVGFRWPSSWAAPTRARRITELVAKEGVDARQVRAMQLDTVAIVHREVVQRLLPLLRPEVARAFEGWDGRADADSRLFLAAEEIRKRAYEAVVAAALQGSGLKASELSWYNSDPTLLAAVRASPEAWRRAGLGDRDAVLGAAVRNVALDGTWGERNRLAVRHPFGRDGGPLGWLFNPPAPPLSGCDRCVRVATPDFGQSMRFVVDFSDPDATTLVLPLGTSGHVWSAHRTDQQRDWLAGDPDGLRTRLHAPAVGLPMVFSP
ncbi:MAG TPA: penicillin acylase family protein [Myxococcaceae bacterium]|nr:penicillin acylase family protein [Myxococcaceae bacterium]